MVTCLNMWEKLYRDGDRRQVASAIKNKYPATIPVAGYYHRGIVLIRPGSCDIPVEHYIRVVHFFLEGGEVIIVIYPYRP